MDDAGNIMWSIGAIAERDGVTRQAVAKIVAKLIEKHDLPVERDSRGRVASVSVVHYDHHRGLVGNGTKAPPKPAAAPKLIDGDSYDEARRQQAWLDLARKRLEHQVEQGELVRADMLRQALAKAGRTIQSEVGRLQNRADDLALAVSKEGMHGARLLLRRMSVEINTKIAEALAEIAGTAPDHDPVIETVDE